MLEHPPIDLEHAGTRDRTALLVLDGVEPNNQDDSRILQIHDSASGLVTQPRAQPAPGSPVIGPLVGTVTLVNR